MEEIFVGDFDFLLPKFGDGIDVIILFMALLGFFTADSGSDSSSINFSCPCFTDSLAFRTLLEVVDGGAANFICLYFGSSFYFSA